VKPSLTRFRVRLRLLLVVATAGASVAAVRVFHFELVRSEPAPGVTARNVSRVSLWFSEAPETGTVAIHVLGAGATPMPADSVTADPADVTAFSLGLPRALAPGAYTVRWRGMADDGHPVRGAFGFTVAAP
jgi:methionine-rich copper-binding protein CopC